MPTLEENIQNGQIEEADRKQKMKNGLITAASILGTIAGTVLLPGVGTAAGASAGTAAAGAAGAAEAATTAAAGASGALGAEAAGKIGKGIAKTASKVANIGTKMANSGKAVKLGESLATKGEKAAQFGRKVAEGGEKFANAQRKYLGDFGTDTLKFAGDEATMAGVNKAMDYFKSPEPVNTMVTPNNNFNYTPTTGSDENLKDSQSASDIDPIEAFSNIDAYLYKYKPEAQEMYAGTGKVNDDQNFGVMAQELAENPLTASSVNQDENGFLEIDGSRLSTVNTAVIGELCKRIMALEAQVYGRG